MIHFILPVDLFRCSQPKLDCKSCVHHPECHCESRCVQQQILKECNISVDSHNLLALHYTHENRTTRIILILSLLINFLFLLLLLFGKPVHNCYRQRQAKRRQATIAQQQATAREQTERFTIALQQLLTPHPISDPAEQTLSRTNAIQPLFNVLSSIKLDNTV